MEFIKYITLGERESTENKRLWIPSSLMKIRFDWGDLLKTLAIKIKKPRKTTRQVTYVLILLHGNSSETGQQMLQLVFQGLDHYLNFLRVPWGYTWNLATHLLHPTSASTSPFTTEDGTYSRVLFLLHLGINQFSQSLKSSLLSSSELLL